MKRHLLIALALATGLLAGQEAAAQKVSVGVLKLASSGPVFIAADQGYFKAEGLDVELKFFEAAQPVAVGIVSGDLDFGVTAFSAALYNLAGKGAIKVIAAQAREEAGYPLNAYLASTKSFQAGFDSIQKLAGKSIAITQTGSSFHYTLGMTAEKLGFPIDRIRLVALQSIPNMISALKGGQVDGVVIPATVALPLIESGDAKLLGWAGDQIAFQINGVFTPAKMVAERRDVAQRFVRGYQAGTRAFHAAFLAKDAAGTVVGGPTRDQMTAVIAKFTEQKPEQIQRGIPFIDPEARLLVGDVHRQVRWYQGQGVVDRTVDPASFIDLGFVQGHLDVPK